MAIFPLRFNDDVHHPVCLTASYMLGVSLNEAWYDLTMTYSTRYALLHPLRFS